MLQKILDIVTPRMPEGLDPQDPYYEFVKIQIEKAKSLSIKYRKLGGKMFLFFGVALGLFYVRLQVWTIPVGFLFFLPVGIFLFFGRLFLEIARHLENNN